MGTFTFALKNGSNYTINTVLESETGFFVNTLNNSCADIFAFSQFQQEKEEEVFQNQPPEIFKFYRLNYVDEDGQIVEDLVGAKNLQQAIADFQQAHSIRNSRHVEVSNSYEKFCNFAALTDEEATAQCYRSLL